MNRLAGQRGVTVIELVVALVVGVISMIGLYELTILYARIRSP